MSDKRAGGIVASSFVAGLLLAAGIFAPRAWEPVPEPFFGLEEPGADPAPGVGIANAPTATGTIPNRQETAAPAQPPLTAIAKPVERLAMGDASSAAAAAAAAQALAAQPQALAAQPQAPPSSAAATSPAPAVVPAAPPSVPATSGIVVPNREPEQPESLRALVARVQAARPRQEQPADHVHPRRISLPPTAEKFADEPLGAAPLPEEAWVDPDSVNWLEAPAGKGPVKIPAAPNPRLGLRHRLRVADRLLGRDRGAESTAAAGPAAAARENPADVRAWPTPVRLVQQLEQIAGTHATDGAGGGWSLETLQQLRGVLATTGPRDSAAEIGLVSLGESVHAGMGIADSLTDHQHASSIRRAALALSRRVAVWRAAAGLCTSLARDEASDDRLESEVARLLDALERFETSLSPADAAVAAAALESIGSSSHPGARTIVKAVADHYLAANVRIAVHQQFLEKMLPETTVTTGPVDDVILGRKVRGTRTVERSTTLRFTPDSDEICFDLEVHGDVESRTITDTAGVSLTSNGASSFTVRKPIKIGAEGLLFGAATGVASNRSQLANVQTSFDSVPIMRSLVRNIVRNQHEESLPEANREVIDTIVSRACSEVDAQAEPKFAELAERIREKVWSPMVRLGLEPTPVAMETTQATATLRLRLASDGQLAAHTPRPRAPADSVLSIQVHDSTLNNALERLGLAGRRLTLENMIALLYERLGLEPRIPEDLPEGVEVAFAKVQPLRVECRDGLVHVRIALDSIESGRRNWYDVVAHVAYKPTSASPQVLLEREGPVQLSGPGHQGRVEFALRTIFSKIFPKERPIPMLPERVVQNPRLAGMHVLQAVSTDGWFAMALGLHEPAATAVRPLPPTDQRRKSLLR